VHSASVHLVGTSSYSLRPRPEDDGAMWPALATRCLRSLPVGLAWAAALLDPKRPLPVICGEPQVREFFHWLQALPNTERVSIGCERQRDFASRRPGMEPLTGQPRPSGPTQRRAS
jgi:hypothetical protein